MHGGARGNGFSASLVFVGAANTPTLHITHTYAHEMLHGLTLSLAEFRSLHEVADAINATATTTGIAACARSGAGLPSALLAETTPATTTTVAFTGGDDGLATDGQLPLTATTWHRATEDAQPQTLTWYARLAAFLPRADLARCCALYLPIGDMPPAEALEDVDRAAQTQIAEDAEYGPVRIYDAGSATDAAALALQTRLSAIRGAELPPVSLVIGTVATVDVRLVGVWLCAALAYVTLTGQRALTGYPLGLVGELDTTWSPSTRTLLARQGIQTAGMQRREGLVFSHDTATVCEVGKEPLYLTRTAQTLRAALEASLGGYRGRTLLELPPLSPLITVVLDAHPAVKEASFDVAVYEIYNRVDIKIDALLYGELSLRVEVRI
jgi:hypothetical protein